MRIYGIDFTSAPRRSKPITCLSCNFEKNVLSCGVLQTFKNFDQFELGLASVGPWAAGIDFPFGLPKTFIDNMGWPRTWSDYVEKTASLSKKEFRALLDAYKAPRPTGDKEHQRATDKVFGGVSPQKQYGVPVALMFYEGARRLLRTNANIPFLRPTADNRMIFEAYPGALARQLIGKASYKSDEKKKQTPDRDEARAQLFNALMSESFFNAVGFEITASRHLINDKSGDEIDALICAIQAAYAWKNRKNNYGITEIVDPTEGWIVGPQL